MATIFTRAKAARKVLELLDLRCGIPLSKLRCDARLESDLGIVGGDTYELLEAMHEDGVDMTEFDCHDRITPEGLPVLPMLALLAAAVGLFWVLLSIFPDWPDWVAATAALVGAWGMACAMSRLFPGTPHGELRVRDLVLSVEAGRWISPKAEQDGGGQPAARSKSE